MKKHHESTKLESHQTAKCNSFHSDLVYQCTPLHNITYITCIVHYPVASPPLLKEGNQRLVLSIQVLGYAYIMYCGKRSVNCFNGVIPTLSYIFDFLLLASNYVLGWVLLCSLTGYCDVFNLQLTFSIHSLLILYYPVIHVYTVTAWCCLSIKVLLVVLW